MTEARDAALRSWGQPGSLHSIGDRALYVLDTARRRVADYLGVTERVTSDDVLAPRRSGA